MVTPQGPVHEHQEEDQRKAPGKASPAALEILLSFFADNANTALAFIIQGLHSALKHQEA